MFCCGNSKMRWPLECESLLCFFGICFPLCVGTLWEGFKTFCNGNFIDESEDNLEVRPFYPGKFQNLLPYKPIPAEQDYYVGRVQQLSISEDAVTPAAVVLSSPKQGDTWQRKKYASTNLYYDDGVPAANGISASRGDAEDEAEDGYQFYQELFSAPGSSPVREGEGAQRSLPYYASFPTYEKRHDLSPPTFNAHSEIRIAERQEHSAGVKLSKEVLVLLGKMSQTLVPLEDRGKLHSPISLPSSAEKSTAAASSATPPRRRRANIPEVQKLDSTLENYDTSEPVTGELEEKRGRNSSEEGSESNQLGASQGMDSSLKDTETLRFFVSVKPRGEESGVETSFAITRAGKKQKKHLKRSAKEEREAEDGNRQRHETGNLETSVLQGQDSTIRGEEPQYGKEAVKIVPKGYAEVRPHSSLAEDEEFGRTALEGSSFLEEDKKTKVEKRLVSAAAGQTEASFAIDSSAYHLMQTQNFLNKYAVTGTEEERSYLARVALVRLAQAAAHQAATSAQTAAAAAPAAAARAAVRGDVAPVIAERAAGGAATPEEELEAIAELEAGTSLFTKVQGLPIDILEAIIATPRDPYSLIRCANGFVAISTSLCAFSMDEELPIKGSCLGAAAFDIELARCFTVSEVEPVASCPIGYRIARMPLDYQYGPCRPAERIPVAPSCDPPFVFDPAVARCLYNSTHAGYLGCPPASISVNETACATASQVLKKVTCPENFEALLTKEGEAECRKTLKGRGNYSASPRCPGNAEELINYELYDEDNKPIVTCVSVRDDSSFLRNTSVPLLT